MGGMTIINMPVILFLGKYAFRALKDYEENGGRRFVASDIGLDLDTNIWTEEERAKRS
jgi:AGCS family alanine or glycine:cation symporter